MSVCHSVIAVGSLSKKKEKKKKGFEWIKALHAVQQKWGKWKLNSSVLAKGSLHFPMYWMFPMLPSVQHSVTLSRCLEYSMSFRVEWNLILKIYYVVCKEQENWNISDSFAEWETILALRKSSSAWDWQRSAKESRSARQQSQGS